MLDKRGKSEVFMIGEYFTPEKTTDVFREVSFVYGASQWNGVIPKYLEKQGLDLSEEEFNDYVIESYKYLNPSNRHDWIIDSDSRWPDKSLATYQVLVSLYSGEWECRVCGPAPKVNPQPAARVGDLKTRGYVIGSKRRRCKSCSRKTMHDILVMVPWIAMRYEHGNELRKPMSDVLKKRIKKVLGMREACFGVTRPEGQLLIDHKYPSQRWNHPESDNPKEMSEADIKNKFQLLNNQTNMLKSRYCDRCVETGKRGVFMGIRWYYQGDEDWAGTTAFDEAGCVGCPWYDLELWKEELSKALDALVAGSVVPDTLL